MEKKRILIIDDDEQIRKLLHKILIGAGYEVYVAADGKKGVQLFHEKPVDLVITDMIMPEKMGVEVILELKEKFPGIKVIAISGGGDFGPELELDMAGTLEVHTIEKPFSPNDILEAVDRLTAEDQTQSMVNQQQVIQSKEETLRVEREFIDQEINRSKSLGCSFGVLALQVGQSVPRGLSKLLPGKTISCHPFEKDFLQIDDSIAKTRYRKYYVVLSQTDENGVRSTKEKIIELAKAHKWGDVAVNAAVYPKDGDTSYKLLDKIS
ncbi:response regulator [Thermodesulfobacteriota bacterium]